MPFSAVRFDLGLVSDEMLTNETLKEFLMLLRKLPESLRVLNSFILVWADDYLNTSEVNKNILIGILRGFKRGSGFKFDTKAGHRSNNVWADVTVVDLGKGHSSCIWLERSSRKQTSSVGAGSKLLGKICWS